MQGQRDLKAVSRLIMSELTPLVSAHHGAFFVAGGERRRRAEAPARRELRLQAAQEGRERVQDRRGARRPGGAREAVDPDHRAAGRLHPDRIGARRGGAAQHHRHAGPLRGRGDGGDRARRVPAFTRVAADVPRAARRDDRRRAQHDPGEHAHRGAARAVAVARRRSCRASRRSCRRSRRSSSSETRSSRSRRRRSARPRSCSSSSRRSSSRRTRSSRRRPPARGAERADRDQEPGDRARALRARGEGRAARALVEVQERVPREHVPRAAHAAQLAADPREAARATTPTAT